MVAAAVVGAGVLGAGASIVSSKSAASAQKSAANQATDVQQQMFNTTQQNLQPFIQAGTGAQNMLTDKLPGLTQPITMDEATLRATPGYQFNLNQGLRATQNSAASRGLGTSGAALKGASQFATGLADNTYQNQFGNAVTNQTNIYNRLLGAAGLGENAAAGVGNAAVQTGANIGNNITGAGNAQGASYIAAGQGIGNAAQSIPGSLIANNFLQKSGLYGGNNAYTPTDFSSSAYTV